MDGSETGPNVESMVRTWRSIIVGDNKSWALFDNGTCVIFRNATGDLAAQAQALLAAWGPVQVGTPSADFSVVKLASDPGWVVTCHHPDILTYVSPDEAGPEPSELTIGLLGRMARDEDAHGLRVVHVEPSP